MGTKSKLFQPKYSQKIQDFIVDKIEEGMTLAEVCREYGPPKGEIVPNEKTCYRWKKKYPEFKKAIDEAYQVLIYKLMDEMHILSKKVMNMAHDLSRTLDISDAKFEAIKLKGEMDACKTRIKTIEFTLTRIAPILVPSLKDNSNQIQYAQLPPINIINYSKPEPLEFIDGTINLGQLENAKKS